MIRQANARILIMPWVKERILLDWLNLRDEVLVASPMPGCEYEIRHQRAGYVCWEKITKTNFNGALGYFVVCGKSGSIEGAKHNCQRKWDNRYQQWLNQK